MNFLTLRGENTAMANSQQHETHRQLVGAIGQLKPLSHSSTEAQGITVFYWDDYESKPREMRPF